jgi:predicted membrane metal-binding protein
MFLQKILVESFFISKKKKMCVCFLVFVLFYRVLWALFYEGSSKTSHNAFYQSPCRISKNPYRICFIKKPTKPNADFVLGKGSSKTPQNIFQNIDLTLLLFWHLIHPSTTGVSDFCFGGPFG